MLAQAEADLNVANSHFQSMQDVYSRDVKSPSATPEATFIQDRDNREEAKATIARAKASRQAAQQNVDYCVIKAPFSGRISRRNVDVNNDVIADTTVLATLIQLDPLYAYFDVDERTLLRIGALCPAAKFPPTRPSSCPSRWGWPTRSPKTSRTRVRSASPTTRWTPPPALCACGECLTTPKKTSDRACLCASVWTWANRSRRCLSRKPPSVPTRGESTCTSSTTKTRWSTLRWTWASDKDGLIAVKPVHGYHLTQSDRVVVNGLQRVHADMEVEPKPVDMPRVKDPAAEPTVVTQKS